MQKDYFTEQLVKKAAAPVDILINVLTVVAAIAAVLVLMILVNQLIPGITSILLLCSVGAVLLAAYLISARSVEYEYIYTNGDLDIDTIIARKRRKRLATIKCENAEAFGKYEPENRLESSCSKVLRVDSGASKNLWYMVFSHRNYGKTLLIFEPNEEMLEFIKIGLPREISNNVFGRR